MELTERTPLYLGLITLSSALAAVTFVWAGLLSFGVLALLLETVKRFVNR
jgi:protein-S-isoprenylcysteine O-methyltransferase Ste14